MDMPVQQAGCEVLPLSVHHSGLRPDAVGGVAPHVGDAAHCTRHIHGVLNLSGAYVDQPGAAHHQLGRGPPLGHAGQGFGGLPKRRAAKYVFHNLPPVSVEESGFGGSDGVLALRKQTGATQSFLALWERRRGQTFPRDRKRAIDSLLRRARPSGKLRPAYETPCFSQVSSTIRSMALRIFS